MIIIEFKGVTHLGITDISVTTETSNRARQATMDISNWMVYSHQLATQVKHTGLAASCSNSKISIQVLKALYIDTLLVCLLGVELHVHTGRSICANCGRVKPTRAVKNGQ